MNLQEAQLIRRVLNLLKGSTGGKLPEEMARELGISARRATSLLMCMMEAQLVSIRSDRRVFLSLELVRLAHRHATVVDADMTARATLAKARNERAFNEIFGGGAK